MGGDAAQLLNGVSSFMFMVRQGSLAILLVVSNLFSVTSCRLRSFRARRNMRYVNRMKYVLR